MTVLKRSQTNRVLFGVCGGIAESMHWDADVVRAVWIVLGAAGGIGVVPYAAAVLLLPEGDVPPGMAPSERRQRNLGLAVIAGAVLLLFLALGIPLFAWPAILFVIAWKVLLPLLLLGIGVFLVWPSLRERMGFTRGRRFARSASNRLLAGVCGGLGQRLGVDPNLVRILAVLLAFLTAGTAVFVYIVLILAVPEESPADASPRTPDAPNEPDRGGTVDQVSTEEHR